MADVDLHAELALAGSDGIYERAIGDRWDVGGRAFGGYGAALALAAMQRATALDRALSLYAMFLNPLQFGPVEYRVGVLRRGRTVAAVQATASQGGREVLSATAWLTALEGGEEPARADEEPDEPDRNWAAGQWPVLDFAERRGAGYPEGPSAFAGQREIELWLQPRGTVDDQLFDVLVLDGHLLDAPLCLRGSIAEPMASLDLSVTWLPAPAPGRGAWRCLRARGDDAGSLVTASGTLGWLGERPYAVAATQALTSR